MTPATSRRLGLSSAVALLALAGCVAGDREPTAAPEGAPSAEATPTGYAAAEARLYSEDGGFVFANGRDTRDIPFEITSDKIYSRCGSTARARSG